MITELTPRMLDQIAAAVYPLIQRTVAAQRNEVRAEQSRRRVAAEKYRKQQRWSKLTPEERTRELGKQHFELLAKMSVTAQQTNAARAEIARIRAREFEPIAVEARNLCVASRQTMTPLTYQRALDVVQRRKKLRYRKQRTQADWFADIMQYQKKMRAEGRNFDVATAKRHVELGLS